MRFRDRLGFQAPLDRVVGSLEADAVLRPQALHDRELLFEARAALFQVDAVQGELVGLVADGDAEDDTPVRHHIEHGDVLGEAHGVMERGHDDVGAEDHLRRSRREPREHGQR